MSQRRGACGVPVRAGEAPYEGPMAARWACLVSGRHSLPLGQLGSVSMLGVGLGSGEAEGAGMGSSWLAGNQVQLGPP